MERAALSFQWPNRIRISRRVIGAVLASAAAHVFAFFLFQVVETEKATSPRREREVQLLSGDIPEHQAILNAVESESPTAALTHRLLPADELLRTPYSPSFSRPQNLPREIPLQAAVFTHPLPLPSPDSPARRAARTAAPTALYPGEIRLGPSVTKRLQSPPAVPVSPSSKPLCAPRFLLGVGSDGQVAYLFSEESSGEPEVDAQAEALLRALHFTAGGDALEWAEATVLWASPPDFPQR